MGDLDGSHVLIRPVARRHPGLFDHRDANWIECECRIHAGSFRGEIRADLRSTELSALLDEVRAMEQSHDALAVLSPEEGRIALTLQRNDRGRVDVNGEAADDGARLQFHFELDPSSLPDLRQALERVLAAFPVVAVPEGAAGTELTEF